MPIRIIIADDHRLFREGLVNLLSDTKDVKIVAQAENGKEAIEKAKTLNPDIVIMDVSMPVLNGIAATCQLMCEMPKLKVIALSMHFDRHYIKGMFEAGACGYLFKNCAYNELIEAIHTVYAGKKYLGEKIAEIVIQDYLEKENVPVDPEADLTERETRILKLLAEGVSSNDVSKLLFVSVKTVSTHKQNILEKLKLKSTSDLVKYAIKKGIISLD